MYTVFLFFLHYYTDFLRFVMYLACLLACTCTFSVLLLHLLFCYHFIIVSSHHLIYLILTSIFQYLFTLHVDSYLTRTSITVLSIATCPCTYHGRNPFLLAFLLLCGDTDIELNPGPSNFTVCTLNIRSILIDSHSAALSGLTISHYPDLMCLTETWIKPTTTLTELSNVMLLITHSAAFLETPQIRLELTLAVAPAFSFVSLSSNYQLHFLSSFLLNHLQSL